MNIADIERSLKEIKSFPPVHLWEPDFCGDIDMRIASDGLWYYMGTPIGRIRLVKLLASVLRKDDDGKTYLVTPVEKIGITVDDAPFVAVAMSVAGEGQDQRISFRTSIDDVVSVDDAHPLRFEIEEGTDGLKPYVLMRGRLEALVNRAVFYDLVEIGKVHNVDGESWFGVWSSGIFWKMAKAADIGLNAK